VNGSGSKVRVEPAGGRASGHASSSAVASGGGGRRGARFALPRADRERRQVADREAAAEAHAGVPRQHLERHVAEALQADDGDSSPVREPWRQFGRQQRFGELPFEPAQVLALRRLAAVGRQRLQPRTRAPFDRRHAVRQLDGGQLAAVDDE
jgi:hypothetical protein